MNKSCLSLLCSFCFFLTTFISSFSQSLDANRIDELIKKQMPAAIKDHREFVSLPNVALNPEDMQKNIEWLQIAFMKRGFSVNILPTETIPIVLAEKILDRNLPTVLFYLHFDGQPVDRSKWDQEHPFTPVIKKQNDERKWEVIPYEKALTHYDPEWRIFGRSAADDKGPILMFLHALDILEYLNFQPAYNLKILLDGEEEMSSVGLKTTLEQFKRRYQADRLIIMDGPAHPTNQPTLTFGCRGIASGTLVVYGPEVPQHSGHFGNYAPNPAFRLANLLASMKDDEGRVLIKGWYDGIDLDKDTRAILAAVPDDEKALQDQIGVAAAEKVGANYQESLQYPSLNIRGMSAAWIGRQTRTIVPDKAVAQIGIRLVTESDGDRLLELFRQHIKNQGYQLLEKEPTAEERRQYPRIASFNGRKAVNAFRTPIDSETGQWLSRAIIHTHGKEPIRIRTMGGTVPVTPLIEALGAPAVIVPMVNMDNNQHSPNENLRLGNFFSGIKTCLGILTEKIE